MSIPFSVRDPSISHTKVENALLPKEGDDGTDFVLYIDKVNKRVGINVAYPEEDLELDGNIQLDTGGVQRGRVKFYDKQNNHDHAEVDGLGSGTNGGTLAFYTKVDGGSTTEKIRINDIGAIGISGANFGDAGATLTSNGSSSVVSWERPYFMEASLPADFTNGTSAPPSFTILNGMTETTFPSPFNYNNGDWGRLTTDKWACPKTGIYSIYVMLQFESANNDALEKAFFLLDNDTTGTSLFYNIFDAYGTGGTGSGDDVDNVPVTGNVISYITEDDEITIRVRWETSSGGIKILAGGGTANTRTHVVIRRII